MATYFIADTHFDDDAIVRYENRPFYNSKEMNASLIEKWNATVKPSDVIYHLGDFGCNNILSLKNTLRQLNGIKFLIRGNHDKYTNEEYRKSGFTDVYDHPIIIDDFYMLSHEPLYVNANMPYCNIYGHIHSNPSYSTKSIRSRCVSVEQISYAPISKESIQFDIKNSSVFLINPEKFRASQLSIKADPEVTDFIIDILMHNGMDTTECTRRLFRNGYYYYFAHMLKTAFQRGTVCWTAPFGHFVWKDDNGIAYDIEGVYQGEALYLIPETYMGKSINDFLHRKTKSFNATPDDIEKIIKNYENDYKTHLDEKKFQAPAITTPTKYGEIRTNYNDETHIYVDAWFTTNDNEEGTIIAKINMTDKSVIYLDDDAKTDPYAQEIIKTLIAELT